MSSPKKASSNPKQNQTERSKRKNGGDQFNFDSARAERDAYYGGSHTINNYYGTPAEAVNPLLDPDWKPSTFFEPETILIQAGEFMMGSDPEKGIPDYETPQHEVFLHTYRIGTYPITNREFDVYIRKKRIPAPNRIGWDGQIIRKEKEYHPVGVTWYEALAYCRWLKDETGREYSLPNEAQWEKACRGGNRTYYPWGDTFDALRCNHGQQEISDVRKYNPQNDYKLFDLVGNVCQWTCSLWGEKQDVPAPEYAYPWKNDALRHDLDANNQIRRVLRGSSFNANNAKTDVWCGTRMGRLPSSRGEYGFRVVLIPGSSF